ncbi:phenylacetate--CoA ligase family protein [Streptomyces hainanensis]|uniref:Phenylacetate--CoA ligase family protein n=1 Tax=Streptomyces hainanensis TaxID=402648 RepID=A0A4R4T3N4_9ACTN|nr:phenylacetate--CoA ligase family protein [Streptomyces hainanensis]TDC71420.1 phenylacetate--CoA ligase family protein [Streptomyces hainanensis]
MSESRLFLLRDTRRAKRQGHAAIAERQRARLAAMVDYARTHSPYHRRLYRDLPERVADSALLPVTSKRALMAHFDDWVTDGQVTLKRARAHVDDPGLIGHRFREKYLLATTSGTTGRRGLFLVDDRSLAVAGALSLRMLASWLTVGDVAGIVRRGGRLAMVNATGGHFMTAATAARLTASARHRRVRVFPVSAPLPQLVAGLNEYQPTVVASYASMAALLADERRAGRLRVEPALMVLSAEGLPVDQYRRIADVFRVRVGHSYAATECPFLSYSCDHGWYHVNSDWLVLEPVDAEYRPTPPGERSHTVLVSNLANRIQPILRYDLGDSVLWRPDPCACGDPLPAIRVQGRAADALGFPAPGGARVTLPPLVFATLADGVPGAELVQFVHTAPATLRVCFVAAAGIDPDRVWRTLRADLARLFADHRLGHVTVERATEPPQQSPGGKIRLVLPL